jgi:hypothetical protein
MEHYNDWLIDQPDWLFLLLWFGPLLMMAAFAGTIIFFWKFNRKATRFRNKCIVIVGIAGIICVCFYEWLIAST